MRCLVRQRPAGPDRVYTDSGYVNCSADFLYLSLPPRVIHFMVTTAEVSIPLLTRPGRELSDLDLDRSLPEAESVWESGSPTGWASPRQSSTRFSRHWQQARMEYCARLLQGRPNIGIMAYGVGLLLVGLAYLCIASLLRPDQRIRAPLANLVDHYPVERIRPYTGTSRQHFESRLLKLLHAQTSRTL